jgi:hypothetical protein
MSEPTTFHFRINGGAEQTLTVKTGVYIDAVAAMPAMLGQAMPFDVEIWSPRVVPEYGPYHYRVERNEFGCIEVKILIVDAELMQETRK